MTPPSHTPLRSPSPSRTNKKSHNRVAASSTTVVLPQATAMGRAPAILLLLVLAAVWHFPPVESGCGRVPVVINFGDSNSDTGGLTAGLGYFFGAPEGRLFFHRPTGRVCDGRLVIDFLCESLNASYLSPYLQALGTDFTNGANFAIAGAATLPRNTPFNLLIQVLQFVRFQSLSLELAKQGSRNVVDEEGFRHAVYTFDIGQNDLSGAFSSGLTYDQVLAKIPSFLSEIKGSIQNIYGHGGRNFWVHGTGPLGCLPERLAKFGGRNSSDLDTAGCLVSLNNAARAFNVGLEALAGELRSELATSTVVYTDVYSIKYDIISNYTKYGFSEPLMACCGHGGPPYNFDFGVPCLSTGFQVCPESDRRISWDGVHYSEAANSIVAARILSGEYSRPPVRFDSFCSAR